MGQEGTCCKRRMQMRRGGEREGWCGEARTLCSTCCLLWDKKIAAASLMLRSMPEPVNSGADCPEHEVHKKEGNQHFAAGDYVKAVAAYNKAIKSDPDNGVLYRYLFVLPLHSRRADDDAATEQLLSFTWERKSKPLRMQNRQFPSNLTGQRGTSGRDRRLRL